MKVGIRDMLGRNEYDKHYYQKTSRRLVYRGVIYQDYPYESV